MDITATIRRIVYALYCRLRDLWSHTNTCGMVYEPYNFDGSERLWYAPSGWSTLKRAHEWLPFSQSDVFVDFGCGKGRIIYCAAKFPLKKIIGIELSPKLLDVAKNNIAKNLRYLICKNIEFVLSDVCDLEIPKDMTVAYMYNAFNGSVFKKVMENIRASYIQSSRKIRLIYLNPRMHEYLMEYDWLRLVVKDGKMNIYETL